MRKNLGNKMMFLPLPVAVIGTYDKNGKANAMTAAWATIYDFGKIFVSMSEHLTTKNIELNKEFTIMFANKQTAVIADYFGIVSGNTEDKIAKSKVNVVKATNVNAPIILEFPVAIECKLVSYEDGNLIGEIVNLNVDDKYLENNKINTDKMELIVFDMANQTYREIGKVVEQAFACGKKIK